MPFPLSFAVRNLGRHRRRTLITASALAVGLGVFLMVDSLLQGADGASQQNLIRYEVGGARLTTPEAGAHPDRLSLKHPLEDPRAWVDALGARGLAATPRLAFEAEVTGAEASRVVRAVGVDPTSDPRVFPRGGLGLEGTWFRAGEARVVLGSWLAQDLGLGVGSTLTLTTRTRSGSFQVLDLEVAGLVTSPDPVLNRGGVLLPLDLVQDQIEMPGQATEVAVALPADTDPGPWAAALEASLNQAGGPGPVRVLSWKDLAGDFLALAASKQKSSGLVLFLVFVIAAVGVGNTMVMTFSERKTEIGMLRALGMDDRGLFWTFLAEAAGIGVLGAGLGLALGAVLVAWLVWGGLDFSSLVRQMDIGYRISGVFYGLWSPRSFVGAGLAGVVLATLCAVGPTRRALSLPITEALRQEG